MNVSSEQFQELSTKQRAVYELLLKKKQAETAARKQIFRLSREVDSFPLSFAQQRLWLVNELHSNSPTYNIPLSVHLHGRLNVQALQQSFREVVLRHESLRTSFNFLHEELRQSIAPPRGFALPVVDLTVLSEDARPSAAEALVGEDYSRPFDLRQSPLFRAILLELGPEEHVLTLTMHHIISDDWSIGVLAREVVTLYEAFSRGHRSPLPELKIQYVDFAHWQRQWLREDVLEKHLAYWDKQLGGDLPKLELPTDRAHRAIPTFRGATHRVNLSKALSESLSAIGEGEGATLFMTLLAAFQVLLHRYTGQDEIIVGSPIANRNRVEVEAIIGFFVNMLVLRTDLSGNPSFRDLLGRVREMTLGAYAHQDLPFEQMVERVQPQRNLSHSPLFQVAFVLQNGRGQFLVADNSPNREAPKEDDLQWSPYSVSRTTAKFDLTLNLQETADGIQGVLEYSTDLFEASSIERMVGHFQNLLQAIAAQPQQRIWSLPLMDDAERGKLLGQAPTGKDSPRPDKCVHHLFEEKAAAHPDSVAVVFEEERLTYAELNRRANQLAHHLRALGVAPETLVGICLEPSLEMVVSILGVLKAGGAYLPLDPADPVERLASMLEDARVQIVLTQQNLAEAMSVRGVQLVCFDSDRNLIEQTSCENPNSGVGAESLAYVIYTSGSTGTPKGVEVVHRNVSSLLAATENCFNFRASDVWTLFHSYAFDFSVWELWGALAYGGRLVIVPYWVARTPEAMYELVSREGVTVMNQTPSAFKQFVAAEEAIAEAKRGTSLRFVIFGGEALDLQSLKRWMGRHGDERPQLVNMYGITETTVHVTYRRVRAEDVKANGGSPIGRPINDWELYLLDREMNLVSQGVSGELYVGGEGVARGYLNRPELTAERFIADEYSGREGSRLYKSGDLGKRGANGEIEYLGRIDHQVKIRGFRIELNEIEAALNLHPSVREAVVLAREDHAGEKRLVAYVVTEDANSSLENLRVYLKGKLPSYMVPSAFVVMDAMPLTPHGKLNKRALLAAELAEPESAELYTPPQTPVEEILAGVWTEVLEIERVGIHDNFFALGGDSIRSIQVRSRAAERGVQFSVQQLFQLQNIHELARAATFAGVSVAKGLLQPFSLLSESDQSKLPEGLEDAYPLAMLQAGMLFHSAYNREAMLYQNVSSFRLRAPFVESAMQSATQQLINRHGVLRTSFDLNNFSEPVQLIHEAIPAPLQLRDIRDLPADEKDRLIAEFVAAERLRHFEWERAPLLRFCIHLLADDTFQFTMTEHHAILDGWSVASLLTELFRVYFSLLDGSEPVPEPRSALTFGDYVALEREALASEECRRFWSNRLSDSTPIILPRPAAVKREHAAPRLRIVNVPISPEVSDGLKRVALKTAVPLKSVLLAAHLRVLSMFGGQPDVMTGLVSNGRPEEADGERVLGLFLNTLPFRLKLAGGTWEELVRHTFDVERELLPYKRYPMAELQKERRGQQLFEVAFNFTHFHVYESLGEISDVEVLGAISLAATNFILGTNFSLSLGDNSRVALTLHCDVAAIGDELADALADSYELVLRRIADEPRARYDSISLLSDAQQQKLLVEWNDTSRGLTVEQGVHHLFEAQAARRPDAIAIVSEAQSLTYGDLNRRADDLASHLRNLGVGPEVPVGMCIEPSLEMIVGVLGILKAGGAYIPLDPADTEEDLSFIIKEVGISTILTQQRLAGVFSNQDVRKICVDEEKGGALINENCAPAEVSAENLACLIHTLGSTGNPKGVMITHGALVNHAQSIIGTYGLESTDRVLQFVAPNCDAAAEEIFPVLASGAAIVLPPHPSRVSPSDLLDHCRRMGVTTLHLPAADWYQLAEELERTARRVPERVKLVIVIGDSPSLERMSRWAELGPPASRFFNSYGQTETTITCLAYEALPSLTVELAKLPIGKPIGNTRAYVLDSFLQPTPIGVVGELHIGGAGLARGYSKRPELTAEKFIPNPFSDEPGKRLYKTGDLACYLPDGNIDFLRRANRQLNLRGFRIELGEIEDQLHEHPGVRNALVVAMSDEASVAEELNDPVNLDHLPSRAESSGEPQFQPAQLEESAAVHDPLSAEERQQIVEGWNQTRRDYQSGSTISQLFEAQVQATPSALALTFETEHLSYLELNRRSNQLARFLQLRGVGPEVLVALLLDSSLSMVVCVLAVLKAGGAYLPLDPSSPPDRLRFMLADAGVGMVLTQQALMEQVADGEPATTVICLDDEWDSLSQQSAEAVESRASAANLAYVIYTSGSTGQPKGTMIPHEGLCNLALAQIEVLGLHAGSRVLQFASWGFDASVSELFTALLGGATLCLMSKERRLPGEELVALLRAEAITVVTFVPSLLAAMPVLELPELETLIVAGEECPTGLARRWAEGRRFYNAYGPTEVTVCATMTEWEAREEKVPIGRPIGNTQVYVLDEQLQAVPVGVTGQLHVGGRGLARGYFQRPELTAEKFIPNHLSGEAGARLYRTGDLARYRADGQLEYVGRADRQVKVRGFRIELGEIEAVLRGHDAVSEAAVVVREDMGADKRLVAYLVTEQREREQQELSAVSSAKLRKYLKERLPDYMVPSLFVLLEKMPLTPNGKLDRRGLPSPGRRLYQGGGDKRLIAYIVADAAAGQALETDVLRSYLKTRLPEYMIPSTFVFLESLPLNAKGKVEINGLPGPSRLVPAPDDKFVAPRTPAEEVIAGIWLHLLGIDHVSIHSDFFDLGGHSISATRLVSQMRKAFHVEVPLRAVFETTTIAEQAELAESLVIADIERLSEGASGDPPPLRT